MPSTTQLLPQTSGGLLAGTAADKVDGCVAAMHRHSIPAALIGMVEAGEIALRFAAITPDMA